MSREVHQGAVQGAIQTIGEVQETLAVATNHCDVAMGAVIEATGAAEVDSAQNAMNYLAGAKEKIDEAYRALLVAAEELRRYGDGF